MEFKRVTAPRKATAGKRIGEKAPSEKSVATKATVRKLPKNAVARDAPSGIAHASTTASKTDARQQFEAATRVRIEPGNAAGFTALRSAAEVWHGMGQRFSAGYAMALAIDAAWGLPEKMTEAAEAALCQYRSVIETEPPESLVALAALHQMGRLIARSTFLFDADRRVAQTRAAEVDNELANRLELLGCNSADADSFLVKGIRISTDLEGSWAIECPPTEVVWGRESRGSHVTMDIPSAFSTYVRHKDWLSAARLAASCENAFVTPGLRGWRAVALGHLRPDDTVRQFELAANEFGADTAPSSTEELQTRGGHWSAVNVELWSRYFRSRARLLEALKKPEQLRKYVDEAVSAWGRGELLYAHPDAMRLKHIVGALSTLLSDPAELSVERASREYRFAIQVTGEREDDKHALNFIADAAAAFRGYAMEPRLELTRGSLSKAVDALSRISVIGPSGAEVIRSALGESALRVMEGPIRTWMHRALTSVADETALHKILLRLLQAGLPKYVHVRHGPIEYGKDIVVLLCEDGKAVLQHYQVKCGDINKRVWRESQCELEEIFLVPLDSFQLPVHPDIVEAVLITNGHVTPFAEPVASGWFREQEQRGRIVRLMHLDSLIGWIIERRLTSELRLALMECGVDNGKSVNVESSEHKVGRKRKGVGTRKVAKRAKGGKRVL